MPQVKTNEHENIKEWDNLIIENTLQKENIPFYQFSDFENVKLISGNIYEAIFKISQKTIVLKCVYLNDKFTPDNLINEIKRHRKLKVHDNILKFYGITKQENTNNYMIILEYVNNGSLRQYLKTNFQKMDWNTKLNLAKQIANVLMYLHSNEIIHGKLNSENILVHNGNIKLNVFGLTKIMPESLGFLKNILGPIQYMDPQYLKLFSTIGKNKSSDIFGLGIILWEISSGNFTIEMESSLNVDSLINITIPGTPLQYKEIYIDCWKHDGNSRPDISQVVKNLSQIIISDACVKFETPPQSQPYNVTGVKLKNLNMQNEEPEIKSDPPFDATTEVDSFINDLFEFYIDVRKKQSRVMQSILIKNYIREHKMNPVKILYKMIRHPFYYLFTNLIGFFYQYGIGTVIDNRMALKFFNLAANEIIGTFHPSNSLSLRKLYNIKKEDGTISLAYLYLDGLGVDKDRKKAFQIYYSLAVKGSLIALNLVAHCYGYGHGVEKNAEKAFKLFKKSAEKGMLLAQSNLGVYYENGIGIKRDEVKAFQWNKKSALAGNTNAMCDIGYCYKKGLGVNEDEKEAFKWYLKAAEKGDYMAQHNLGCCYAYEGIYNDYKKAFEWYKKAAENDLPESQYMVGMYFYGGFGTGKSIIEAIYWLNKAKENGNIAANRALEEEIDRIIFYIYRD
ncbi:hypothetical protein Glove_551g20 [Diversispora epigaea]|uniref:Protein kinase domain-containing protein n=1 Tax=Diversispora epigaea TaxID=1348612 RepID=A0A397GFK4_9GLOM|nr:hypothetical protein Glove_551g20 [Diversispora epigaea]